MRLRTVLAGLAVALSGSALPVAVADEPAPAPTVPAILQGETWVQHLRDDLMPYWDMPEALGDPLGNFPTFRDRAGHLDPDRGTYRGLGTLSRGVYGYCVAFAMTGDERYLTYAKAGLDWIEQRGYDAEHDGWYPQLTETGEPRTPLAPKPLADLAALGLAYGMYYDVTRDPDAEAGLLRVRDLIFSRYYDAQAKRFLDARTYDMSAEVDTGNNGEDIVDPLVTAAWVLLPYADLLSDPARRAQFRSDLRTTTQVLLDRHRNRQTPETWWFWGRTKRIGVFTAAQTDFGHTLKSHDLVYNADQVFPDRPWSGLAADRQTVIERAWDDSAARWNLELTSFAPGGTVPDAGWFAHAEADELVAALDLRTGFSHSDQLARAAQSWMGFVDRDPAYPGEVWARVLRDGTIVSPFKSAEGKNMYHAFEHALVMYLHGRAMQGLPAVLHYAFPDDEALTAPAKPYWFDATGEHRVVGEESTALPGHRIVTVGLTGLDSVPPPLYPPPDDTTAPVSTASLTPSPNEAGWSRTGVEVGLAATDDVAGVRDIRVQVVDDDPATPDEAWIDAGDRASVTLSGEGAFTVRYWATDALGNVEDAHELTVRIDLTTPTVSGLPADGCEVWPPDGRMVQVADVSGQDALSGVASDVVTVTADEQVEGDWTVGDGVVEVRAERDGEGDGRVYTVTAVVTDVAGNQTTASGTCTVPHDVRRPSADGRAGSR